MKTAKLRVRWHFADGTSAPMTLDEFIGPPARQRQGLGIDNRSVIEQAVEEGRRIECAIQLEKRQQTGIESQGKPADWKDQIVATIAANPSSSAAEISALLPFSCSARTVQRWRKRR